MAFNVDYYHGKTVLVTGHTGFKGSWLCTLLVNAGAKVIGYSTCSPKEISLFKLSGIENQIVHIQGDVCDLDHLLQVFREYQPEIVIHMAAQAIVRESYVDPVRTYSTNVMGTVSVCEAVRHTHSVRSFLNVTTDKVYENREWVWGYRENDPLDGFDPYSNSKSCSELVTHSYRNSYFTNGRVSVSTARAGNVIGGGDFARDRVIPDCVRAAIKKETIIVRNPYSVRPYQHVLEPVYAYLMIAAMQVEDASYASWYNVGPDDCDSFRTGELVDLFIKHWGDGLNWVSSIKDGPHEANYLKLDCSKIKNTFGWAPCWDLETAVEKVVEWTKAWLAGKEIRTIMDKQIEEYVSGL